MQLQMYVTAEQCVAVFIINPNAQRNAHRASPCRLKRQLLQRLCHDV